MVNLPLPSFDLHGETYVVVKSKDFSDLSHEKLLRLLGVLPLEKLTLGYLVRQHRNKLGLTQSGLARLTTTTQKHIDKIENGEIKAPRDQLLKELQDHLGPDFTEAYQRFIHKE